MNTGWLQNEEANTRAIFKSDVNAQLFALGYRTLQAFEHADFLGRRGANFGLAHDATASIPRILRSAAVGTKRLRPTFIVGMSPFFAAA
ncbi:hypothetical protein XH88_36880 [Bradyrhizobium sp. CCBAU 51627]|nr:hypothetical protein [Bradyrhizobium sp. CCBAU 51627]